MIQTYQVIERLRQQWPDLEITIEQVHTRGDHITDVPLSQVGGDGVFVTEIERALHEKRIDVAVHSLKDLPTIQPVNLRLVIMGPREDVRDVFVAHEQGLQPGNNIRTGTCSLRRMAQLRSLYPDAHIMQWLSSCEGQTESSPLHLVTHNSQLKIACIGPITSQTVREHGLPVHIEAQEFTIEGLVEAIVKASLAANAC